MSSLRTASHSPRRAMSARLALCRRHPIGHAEATSFSHQNVSQIVFERQWPELVELLKYARDRRRSVGIHAQFLGARIPVR
jgi:hypothetical protein